MRLLLAFVVASLGFQPSLLAQTSCPAGSTTSISGVVYAPNGTDPLPNVTVYVPTVAVDAFTPGVSCPVIGQTFPGSPTVGTMTATDGSFTINNVPVGASVPLVIVSGRWRRQVTVATTACANTVVDKDLSRFPRNQSEGDIPKIAVATGAADSVECVLRKVGIDDTEFTNPSGTGRINFFKGSTAPGATIDATTPSEAILMGTSSTLNEYDVLMLPCEGQASLTAANGVGLANLVFFANAGGRVYSSHFSYSWMWKNPPFDTVANWTGNTAAPGDGPATVVTSFPEGQTLSDWLQLVGASTTPGQIGLTAVKRDFSSINSPTQSWLTLNSTSAVMQFVFDTPVSTSANQCGRVLFNEYHVENPAANNSPTGKAFPAECSGGTMTAQEKLLEFSLFELTSGGGSGSIAPTSQDFGSEPVNFTTAPKPFTWTNNSPFQVAVSSPTASGDFSVLSHNCSTVAAGASCQINVVFKPTALGARTGTLSVSAGAQTVTSALTGTGVVDLTFSPSALDFGSIDVGATTAAKSIIVTNAAPGGVAMPALTTTGDFASTTTCASTIPANSACSILVTFKPTTSGARSGTVAPSDSTNAAYGGASVALTGNGLDFAIVLNPTSGSVIAGISATTVATVSPLAGFAANVTLTCTTSTPGSACSMSKTSFVPTATSTSTATITTTSTYTVVGFGGIGGKGALLLIALTTGCFLSVRRRMSQSLRRSFMLLLLCAAGLSLAGCGGKQPAQNANPTTPGSYTYTVSATDGTITHTATYTLTVTKN